MKNLFKFFMFLAIFAIAAVGCKKDTDKNNGGGGDPDNPPGNNTCPPVSGITSTEAGKVAETIFVEHYKKMTQDEQDLLEPLMSDFRKKSNAANSENESNDLATLAGLIAGEGYTPNLIGTIAATAVLKGENNPYALYNLGGFLRMTGKNKQALPVLQQAAQLCPSSAPILCALGSALFDDGDVSGAEMKFNDALKKDPDCPFATEGLAAVYYSKGTKGSSMDLALENYCSTLLSFKPNASSKASKNIAKAVDKAIEDDLAQLILPDDDLAPLIPPVPKALGKLMNKESQFHVVGRPSSPQFNRGEEKASQEHFVGSKKLVDREIATLAESRSNNWSNAITEHADYIKKWSEDRPRSEKGKAVYAMNHIEQALEYCYSLFEFQVEYLMKGRKQDDIYKYLTSRDFFNFQKTYQETEYDFQYHLKKHNIGFETMDKLLEYFYINTQNQMDKFKLEADYKLADHTRRTQAASAICDYDLRVLLFIPREDREPQKFLEKLFERGYTLAELIPFKGCKTEGKTWEKFLTKDGKGYVTITTIKTCVGVETKETWSDKNAKPPADCQNNIYKQFRKSYNFKGSRSSGVDDEEALYISYNKYYGEASFGSKTSLIIPGSSYDMMVGLYCGIEIK